MLLKVPEAEGLYLIKVAIVVAAVEVDSFVVMSIVNMIAPWLHLKGHCKVKLPTITESGRFAKFHIAGLV